MKLSMKPLILLPLFVVLAACETVPPTNVHQPMTARPSPRPEVPGGNGSIYQAGFTRPLFEDRRARYVGDTITIKISEATSASTKSNTNLEKSSSQSAAINNISRLPGRGLIGLGVDASSSTTMDAKGDAANNNVFTGNLTATVIEVLPNGNLLVSGEKQLAIGGQTEYIRVSGIVNPSFVTIANEIESAKIADARIEYKSAGVISEAQVMGWLARFFLSVLPF